MQKLLITLLLISFISIPFVSAHPFTEETIPNLTSNAPVGTTEVTVYVRPRVAILSTGNEIADLGQPLKPGQIYDINKFTLTAIVTEHGGYPEPHRTATDTIKDLSDAVLQFHLMVSSGSFSFLVNYTFAAPYSISVIDVPPYTIP